MEGTSDGLENMLSMAESLVGKGSSFIEKVLLCCE
tara:strand:- start:1645 stop:1749 length:105 start_codon:yes stop_codon:yes gene_type:complete